MEETLSLNIQNAPPVKNMFGWFLFVILSIVWGSSFILMKKGLLFLSAVQVASLRIIFSSIVLLPWSIKYFRNIPTSKFIFIILSGILGSLIPAYLFCYAEEKIDSGLAGTLNSLTPVFVVLTGTFFFKTTINKRKILGIAIAFAGSLLLLFTKGSIHFFANAGSSLLIVIATISYGINANLIYKYLHELGSLKIASVALTICSIPATIILYGSGFFNLNLLNSNIDWSLFYTAILGVLGTAIATILYYMLVKKSGAVFSSMVTYCIPIVANIWGLIFGEHIGILQFLCLMIILCGVYIANINFKMKMFLSKK